ncbi:MAG TPA: hypothetical protein VFM06_01420 [Candidatus Limnocylindria bacterium]|nr:hypothetical protein [Candidatus Limnocylindria bacterium]
MADLKTARERVAGPAPQAWREVLGFTLCVAAHGAGRYPILLDCAEFRLQITDSTHLPTVYVQLRSAFIHEVGIREAVDASRAVAEQVVERAIPEPHAGRLDLYADFADWVIRRDDVAGLVTNAKIATHGRAGTDELETVMVGKTPMALRIYRKDEEVRARGGFAPLFWSGHQGPVVRVEAQASTETLRAFQIRSVGEAITCHGDVWAWATSGFVELRRPGVGDREDWRLAQPWELVQAVGLAEFPRCGLVPYRVVQASRAKVLPSLLGYLSSYAALEDVNDPKAVLGRLLAQFPDLTWSSAHSFRDEVERKRALLPRTYRYAQERERDVASGRDRPPSPEGGDSESSTVGSDA